MRKRIAAIVALALAAASGQGAIAVRAEQSGQPPSKSDIRRLDVDYVPGEVLVEFRRGLTKQSRRHLTTANGGRSTQRVGDTGIRVVKLQAGVSVQRAVKDFRSSRRVVNAEPNLVRRVEQFIPDDTLFSDLWGLNNEDPPQQHPVADPPPATSSGTADADIDAPEAWDTQQGSTATVIAVLDTGIDVTHPDLDGSLWTNPGETPGNGVDDDGNGYIDDVNGFDFAENDATLLHNDPSVIGWDHGTHVSGTIAAEINNATGVAGVCPNCKIMTLKGFEPVDIGGGQMAMSLTLANELEALDYAADMGADVLNGSYGNVIATSKMQRQGFVDLGKARPLLGKPGVLSVLAAGNSNGDNDMLLILDLDDPPDGFADTLSPAYPASYNVPQILAVAASNHNDELAYATGCAIQTGDPTWPCAFTNWGHDSVDLAAPGVDIVSTVPVSGGSYATFDGTSMATPHTTGVAGLVKSAHPDYGPTQIKNAIMNSVNKPASLNTLTALPGFVDTGVFVRSDGRLNAAAAINAPNTNSFPTTDGNINGAKGIRRSKSGRVNWPGDTNDVYKKRLVKGKRYRATLTVPNNRDFDLFAYKPGTTDIWQFAPTCRFLFDGNGPCQLLFVKAGGAGVDEVKTFKPTKTGTYYFQPTSFFSTGNYRLTIKRL